VDAHIHDIRHNAITEIGEKGYSLQQIAKALGHSQISTTLRYMHLRAEEMVLTEAGRFLVPEGRGNADV
jgi:site-specific recombinase XerD